jgi:hypothetical protein
VKKSQRSIFLILLLVSTLAAPSALAATKPKAAGRSSTSVVNTILNGKGAPSNTLGIDGDFYIDTRSLLISGPKTKGKWPAARSLQGASGINGVDGKNGADAKNVSTASTVAGPVGPQGPQGERGEKGADGAAGASGSAGPTGAPGPAGATGPAGSGATGAQGPSGSNGATGATGAQGAQGAQGPAGSTGATGATGETGTAGATGARGETGTAGPSEVTVGTLTFANISGAVGSTSASNLTGLKAGKSYLVRLLIHAYHPNDRFLNSGMILNLTTAATSGSPVITKQYIPSFANTYRNGAEGFEWSIDAQLVINGALVANDYGVTITVTAGKSTTVNVLKIDCDFTATLVGEVK